MRLNDLKANIVKLNVTKKHENINENRLSWCHPKAARGFFRVR
jgi:hypothetical protein